MADPTVIAERVHNARERLSKACAAVAAGMGVAPPAVRPHLSHDPKYVAMQDLESAADFIGSVAEAMDDPAKVAALAARAADRLAARAEQLKEDAAANPSGDPGGEHRGEGDGEGNGEEPLFHGKPLSAFDGLDDGAILSIDGIGKATLAKIRSAQKALGTGK
jgi:hypothetical protein